MNELKRTLRDLDANLRRVNRELRNAKRRASELGKFRLREPQRTTARILVAMHQGELTAAMDYIQRKRKDKGLDHTMAAQAESELREWWRGADDATKQSHRVKEGTSLKMQSAFKQAERFSVDAGLEAWVEDQNVQKGINPAPSLLLRQASMLKASLGVNSAPSRRGERRWMQRWRTRRGLQLRKFPAQERLPVDQMQRKVRHQEGGIIYISVAIFCSAPDVPHKEKGWPFSGPIFQTSLLAGKRNRTRKSVLFLKSSNIFTNARLPAATQRLQHFGAGAITCKPAPHLGALWWSSTLMRPM